MLHELIERQQSYLTTFFEKFDQKKAEQIIEKMSCCRGTILLTGVGKSALVAQKIAATLTSTGTRALYLSPTDALHGDLGIVSAGDMMLLLSKSGESDELLQIVPFLHQRGLYLIAVVCQEKSRLARICDDAIALPCSQELCPFDLAPTTSAAIQMIFGDLIAVSLMHNKGFSIEEYACNHPGGKIGKRIALRVADMMLQGEALPTCAPDAKLIDLLVLLSDKRCGCLLVVDQEQKLLGIFTDGDLRRALQLHGAAALDNTIDALMTSNPRWIAAHELAYKAMELMEQDPKRPITVLPVIDNNRRLQGLIKMHDIVQTGL